MITQTVKCVCDRCGQEVPLHEWNKISLNDADANSKTGADLCRDCKYMFYKWLNEGKQEVQK